MRLDRFYLPRSRLGQGDPKALRNQTSLLGRRVPSAPARTLITTKTTTTHNGGRSTHWGQSTGPAVPPKKWAAPCGARLKNKNRPELKESRAIQSYNSIAIRDRELSHHYWRRPAAARPARPRPMSSAVPGSGTTVIVTPVLFTTLFDAPEKASA